MCSILLLFAMLLKYIFIRVLMKVLMVQAHRADQRIPGLRIGESISMGVVRSLESAMLFCKLKTYFVDFEKE